MHLSSDQRDRNQMGYVSLTDPRRGMVGAAAEMSGDEAASRSTAR